MFLRCCLDQHQNHPETCQSGKPQLRTDNSAVIISGNSLVFSRKIITSTGFYRYCAPDASAPVVVKNQSPILVPWLTDEDALTTLRGAISVVLVSGIREAHQPRSPLDWRIKQPLRLVLDHADNFVKLLRIHNGSAGCC